MLQPPESSKLDIRIAVKQFASKLGMYHMSRYPVNAHEEDPWYVPIVEKVNLGKLNLDRAPMIEVDLFASNRGLIGELRQRYPSKLISVRLKIDEAAEDEACRLFNDGADVIHLCADYHGFDYSKTHSHISHGLRRVHTRLVNDGIRYRITLIASGGDTRPQHLPQTVLFGAGPVGIRTTTLPGLPSLFKSGTRNWAAFKTPS